MQRVLGNANHLLGNRESRVSPVYGSPPGPTAPLRQAYPIIPFVQITPGLSVITPFNYNRNTRSGRGIFVPVTVAANTPITVTHNLGRIPQGVTAVINNMGLYTNPDIALAPNPSLLPTRQQATIEGNTAMFNCLVWFY